MIKDFFITNYKNESLLLELERPEQSGISVRSCSGLGPPGADVNTTDLANSDIAIFNSAKLTSRNIILQIGLKINYELKNIEQARMKVYKYFPSKKKIRFQVDTTEKSIYIYGYVENVEPDIFSQDELINISIICPDPYFKENKKFSQVLSGLSRFKFPFSNECPNYSFIAKWKDSKNFTWGFWKDYNWKWKDANNTIGTINSYLERLEVIKVNDPNNKDKINEIINKIRSIDTLNKLQLYPVN